MTILTLHGKWVVIAIVFPFTLSVIQWLEKKERSSVTKSELELWTHLSDIWICNFYWHFCQTLYESVAFNHRFLKSNRLIRMNMTFSFMQRLGLNNIVVFFPPMSDSAEWIFTRAQEIYMLLKVLQHQRCVCNYLSRWSV